MNYVNHPWINPGTIEKRSYQENIVKTATQANTLCVLPTGMGKTSIAALVAADRMKSRGGRVLFLAPTRPLVEQHRKSFEKFFKLGVEMKTVTGENDPADREKMYRNVDVLFSTPQTIRNDLKTSVISLKDFTLCIFDEAHRCVGNYAYTYIARRYAQESKAPLILGLTASPGSQKWQIDEIKNKLSIERVEIRTRESEDVQPYVQDVENEWAEVELPAELKAVRSYLESVKDARIKKLISWRIINSYRTTKTQLLSLQQKLAKKKTGPGYMAMSYIAEIIKLDHALLLLETQTLHSLKSYMDEMMQGETKAVERLSKEESVKKAVRLINELVAEGREHPKLGKLKDIVSAALEKNKMSRIIIFAQYRSTIGKIHDTMREIKGAAPVEFIGQAKKHGKGLSQKEQVQILNEFKMGFYNVLCASQVAEEGLDVVETDMVVFYEPVPSAIRKIQRSGRTARTHAGRIIVLLTKNTRDEAYYWTANRKEKSMNRILSDMQNSTRDASLSDFKTRQKTSDVKEESSDYEEKTSDFKSE